VCESERDCRLTNLRFVWRAGTYEQHTLTQTYCQTVHLYRSKYHHRCRASSSKRVVSATIHILVVISTQFSERTVQTRDNLYTFWPV